ncbi:hypothetical protein D3C81_1342060 [compost metagenome]
MDNDIICRASNFMLEAKSDPAMRFICLGEIEGCYGICKGKEFFVAVFIAMKSLGKKIEFMGEHFL